MSKKKNLSLQWGGRRLWAAVTGRPGHVGVHEDEPRAAGEPVAISHPAPLVARHCVKVLSNNIEEVESFEGLLDSLMHKIAAQICRSGSSGYNLFAEPRATGRSSLQLGVERVFQVLGGQQTAPREAQVLQLPGDGERSLALYEGRIRLRSVHNGVGENFRDAVR
ncbi:hypothetical protein KSP39_PZI009431 [Platanthera zijinensis]|uniref:Uncharacterized protein n=1 Tax=Platanthera zijinensis TaxID=2320716 RepID=A0AAP0BL86_9ASPA